MLVDDVELKFVVIPPSFNLSFTAILLDPCPVPAIVDATNLRLTLIKSDGGQEFLADIPLPLFHITPGTNTTIKIPVVVISLAPLVDALKEALQQGVLVLKNEAALVIHLSVWPFPIHAYLDKTTPPMPVK